MLLVQAGTPINETASFRTMLAFFDQDKDGIIWPLDTYRGLRELGFGYFWTILGMLSIHLAFSWITWGTTLPDPFFRLKVNRMHKGKHGSDTEIYTGTGEFDPDRFDYMFKMYTEPPHTHMSIHEARKMMAGDRNPLDPFSWICAFFEWIPLFVMLDPPEHKITREDVEAVYNVSAFLRPSPTLGRNVEMRHT
ncbi:putative peroxygenase 3 [Leucoagaricus sp. SymC.cos]|nr:putative peroxygenase 3 [Leucoagaricus sp. SymC.cos]